MLLFKNLLFTVVVPGSVGGYLPWFIGREQPVASGPMLALSIVAFAIGAPMYLWCLWDFATYGRGTPLPLDPPKRLVIRGLYRWVRNPMYVTVLIVILGWSLFFQSIEVAAYGLVVFALCHTFILVYEEPHLRRVFGPEYEAYRARVGRWIPRPPRTTTTEPVSNHP
jgi:protein-S-isoprenylcysteine O-methyltransferase Ste14